MGCSLSKKNEDDDVVSLCRERKRLMKSLIKQRQAFAESHSKYYINSISSVSSALRRLLLHRLLADEDDDSTNQTPIFPITAKIEQEISSNEEEEDDNDDEGGVCEFFYEDKQKPPPPMPSPERGQMWDFFGLFDTSSGLETMSLMQGMRRDDDHDDKYRREEEDDQKGDEENGEKLKVKMIDEEKEEEKKGLWDVLRDVEEQFARVSEFGLDLSRMLEINDHVHPPIPSYLGEFKDTSWHQSNSTQSSPCKSLLSYSSATSSTWTECRSDLFDGCGGMRSGSHSFTLGRLYAWEKKLFQEVKAGAKHSKSYRKKCVQLKWQGEGEDDLPVCSLKDKAEITNLYTKILVSRRSANSIFNQIEKLRDEELQPQILELLDGLMRTWKMTLKSHEVQARTMHQVKSCSSYDFIKICNDSHRIAILELEAALHAWQTCFSDYMDSQKAYIKTLHRWVSMFVGKESDLLAPVEKGVRTLLVTCQKWIDAIETLPEKAVINAIRGLAKDVRSLSVQQGKEQHHRRRVDRLAKGFDSRTLAPNDQVGCPSERKDFRDQLMKKLELEKAKHQAFMAETQRNTLNAHAVGFTSVFESLVDFSTASVKLYADLLAYYEIPENERSAERDQ